MIFSQIGVSPDNVDYNLYIMKKIIAFALVFGMITSCYQPTVSPLQGSKGLYSYSANVKGQTLYGVKAISLQELSPNVKKDKTVVPPLYVNLFYKNGAIYGNTVDGKTTIYTSDGKKIFGPAVGVHVDNEYFTVREDNIVKVVIVPLKELVIGPMARIEVIPEGFLYQNGGLCGILNQYGQEIAKGYEKITRVSDIGNKSWFYLGKPKSSNQWKKISADGKTVKNIYPWQTSQIQTDAKGKGGFGDETLGGIYVTKPNSY